MPLRRRLVLAALFCAAVAWLAGPPGRMLALLPLLLFGPGFLIERALRPFAHPTPFLLPPLWLGLSLSAIALLYEWATALGLALALPALALLAAGCALGVIALLWRADPAPPARAGGWALALGAVVALTVWTRIAEIGALALPAWVDSVHHALLIRVAAERGMAPLDLRPYLPIAELPYHWGYHVFVATLLRLAGGSLPAAMLWSGQALNALHALAAAGLAAYLWRRPMAGVAAAIIVGLISIMPAYYLSWGRYTQLTGLLLLAPICACWLELLRAPSRRLAATLALLLAGLSLIHFIVLIFALAFLAVSGAAWLLSSGQPRKRWKQNQQGAKAPSTKWNIFRRPAARAALNPFSYTLLMGAASGLLALALAAPWLLVLVRRKLLPTPDGSALPLIGGGTFNKLDVDLLWAGQNRMLIALALAAALWGLRRHRRAAATLVAWLAVLTVGANPWLALYIIPAGGAALALGQGLRRRPLRALAGGALLLLNPWLVRLPFLSLLTNEALVISLFLPVGVLIGGGAAWVWAALAPPRPAIGRALAALALAALAGWGAWNLRDVLNPKTVFASAADVAAIEWAAANTPADARFLVNTAGWLGTGRGSDGGWWLLPLAGRWASAPPVIYDYAAPEYVRAARARNAVVSGFEPGRERQLYDLIDRERITYVYLNEQTGPLNMAAFPAESGFEKVYQRDGVAILKVTRR